MNPQLLPWQTLLVCFAMSLHSAIPGLADTVDCPLEETGSIYRNHNCSPIGYHYNVNDAYLGFDDGICNRTYRAYVWFDLRVIPSEVAIADATMGYGCDLVEDTRRIDRSANVRTISDSYSGWLVRPIQDQWDRLKTGQLLRSIPSPYNSSHYSESLRLRTNAFDRIHYGQETVGFSWDVVPEGGGHIETTPLYMRLGQQLISQ